MQIYDENNQPIEKPKKVKQDKVNYDNEIQNHLKYYNAFKEVAEIAIRTFKVPTDRYLNISEYTADCQLSDERRYAKLYKEYIKGQFERYTGNDLFDLIITSAKNDIYSNQNEIHLLAKDLFTKIKIKDLHLYLKCKELYDFVACLTLFINDKEHLLSPSLKEEGYHFFCFNCTFKSYYSNKNFIKISIRNNNKLSKKEIEEKELSDYFTESCTFKGNFINQEYNNIIFALCEAIFKTPLKESNLPIGKILRDYILCKTTN